MDAASFSLLKQTTNILVVAAKYYVVSNSKTAAKAREAVSKDSIAHEPFHAAIHVRLLSLQSSLESPERINLDNAVATVRRTLDTFELLVGRTNDLEKTSGQGYAGLQLLQVSYNADAVSKRRPKPLSFRKFLFCPPEEMRRRLKDDIVACHSAIDSSVYGHGDAAILSDLETIHEWRAPPSMLREATRVRGVLSQHMSCTCADQHRDIKLAFTASPKTASDTGVVGCYRLGWPIGESHRASTKLVTPWLHLTDTTVYASAAPDNAEPSQKRAKGVRFSIADDSSACAPPTVGPMAFASICEAVRSSRGVIRVNETTVTAVASGTNDKISAFDMVPLRTLLSSREKSSIQSVKPKDRITTAVALAYIYLHLSDTARWSKNDVLPNFWFMNDATHNAAQTRLPFLSFHIDGREKPAVSTESYINPLRPSLPAFGKLLLEIWKGAPLSWGEQLDSAVADCELDPLGEYWLCAVNACLGTENVLKEGGPLRESSRMRSVFVLKVVKSLQWLLEKCVRLPMDSIFAAAEEPFTNGLATAKAFDPSQTGAPVAATLGIPRDANAWCLHDDSDGWEPSDKKGVEAAAAWLSRLREEVHPLIQPTNDLIRVAVIDTGVLFDRRTRLMYASRVREVRSFVPSNCGESGVLCPEGEDFDGHGTHATSLFLETDPYSEVFVAKVFESRHEKQSEMSQKAVQERIAKAIKYAVDEWKVQVISISFGFAEQVKVIRDALVAAESSNVVVLAAASNCGGVARLSWPARHATVIGVHANDGYCNKYRRNPSQQRHDDNFSVLGTCVKSWWPSGQKVLRSGTSTATPIAAGIASMTLHFMSQHGLQHMQKFGLTNDAFQEMLQQLSTYSGMRSVFRLMVERQAADRDGYSCVVPWWLFDKLTSRDTIFDQVLAELRQA